MPSPSYVIEEKKHRDSLAGFRICLGYYHVDDYYKFWSLSPGNRQCEKCQKHSGTIGNGTGRLAPQTSRNARVLSGRSTDSKM